MLHIFHQIISVTFVMILFTDRCVRMSSANFLQSSSAFGNYDPTAAKFSSINQNSPTIRNYPPLEQMRTPNFDVIWLEEEPRNPTWNKYSSLFPSKVDIRTRITIQVNYISEHCVEGVNAHRLGVTCCPTKTNRTVRPSLLYTPSSPPSVIFNMGHFDAESVLSVLGNKKHIIVLHPRNNRHDDRRDGGDDDNNRGTGHSMKEFETVFLPKILQKLYQPAENDPVINRILQLLDNDVKKLIDVLHKTFVTKNPEVSSVGRRNNHCKCPEQKESKRTKLIYSRIKHVPAQRRCPASPSMPPLAIDYNNSRSASMKLPQRNADEKAYVFLVENQGGDSTNDLLLRILKIVGDRP